jgi:hypothetical protein
MKYLLLLLVSFNLFAIETVVQPMLVAGFRPGDTTTSNGSAGYVGGKVSFLKHETKDFNQINLMALGLNYQTDGKFSVSVSPISFTTLGGATIGLDLIKKESDAKGGAVGFFVGMTFK